MVRSVDGSSGRYSFTASGASSSSDDYYDDELDKSPSTYFDHAASAAIGSHSPTSRGGTTTPPPHRDLADILVPTSYSPVRKHYNDQVGISPLESNSGEHSPPREYSPRYQEYYDVLALANNRLSKTAQPPARLSSEEAVILGEGLVEKKKKSKKKKKKDKKEKRKKRQQEEDDVDVDGRRRSSVFQTVFQPSLLQAHSKGKKTSFTSEAEIRSALEISKRNDNNFTDEENALDPNDEIPPPATGPMSWSPAALVNASRSKQSGGKTDHQGYYAQVGGSSSTTRKPAGFGSWVQNLMQPRGDKELPKDYNLNSRRRKEANTKP